jgi:hypothetical protein
MPEVTLGISPREDLPGQYLVVVGGEGFHASAGAAFGARIRAEDTFFDDHLFSIGSGHVGPDGIFSLEKIVPGSQLNEDFGGRDEIYAIVEVEGFGSFRSNTVKAFFS